MNYLVKNIAVISFLLSLPLIASARDQLENYRLDKPVFVLFEIKTPIAETEEVAKSAKII